MFTVESLISFAQLKSGSDPPQLLSDPFANVLMNETETKKKMRTRNPIMIKKASPLCFYAMSNNMQCSQSKLAVD